MSFTYNDAVATYDSLTVSFDGLPLIPGLPTVTVEVAWTANASDPIASMAWTPLDGVRSIKTRRGKQHERNTVQAGTMTLLVDNRDGRLSPWNTASPYYPNVLPMRPIRVTATWAGTVYPVWFGYVEAWPMRWADPVNNDVEISATDGFKLLAMHDLNEGTIYRDAILADTPHGYWRLDDPLGSGTVADSSGNGHTGTVVGMVAFQQTGALTSENDTAALFGNAVTALGGVNTGSGSAVGTGTAAFSGECWAKVPSFDTLAVGGVSIIGGLGGWKIGVETNPTSPPGAFGKPYAQLGGSTGSFITRAPVRIDDGRWHHLALVRYSATTWALWVDGVRYDDSGTPGSLGGFGTDGWISMHSTPFGVPSSDDGATGPIDEVAVYSYALSDTQIADHIAAATGYLPDRSGERVITILDAVGWPVADRAIDAGNSSLQGETRNVLTTNALSYIQQIERSEDGLFYMDADGKATFRGRQYVLTNPTSTTSQATLGGGAGEMPYRLEGTNVGMDDLDIWNDAAVSRIGGQLQTATDTASRGQFGKRTLPGTTDLMVASDAEAANRAAWIVGRYKDPQTRVGAVSVDPRSDPASMFPKVLGLDLLDLVTFRRATLDGGSMFEADQVIEGVEHQITAKPAVWRTVWNLAPAVSGSFWVWGTSTWGVTTRWAY